MLFKIYLRKQKKEKKIFFKAQANEDPFYQELLTKMKEEEKEISTNIKIENKNSL